MPVTNEQRADIGTRYVDEIKRRIGVRTAAKVRVRELPGRENADVLAAAQADLKELTGGTKLVVRAVSTGYRGTISIGVKGGESFALDNIPFGLAKRTAALVAYTDAEEAQKKKNQALCQELEFLNGVIAGNAIGGFQSYVSRLWAPAGKAERLNAADFKRHVESYLDTKRGFTCSL